MLKNLNHSRININLLLNLKKVNKILVCHFSSNDRVDFTFDTLVDMQIKSCKHNYKHPCLGTRNGKSFDYITYGEFGEQVDKFRGVLAKHNIGKDDKVALISNNRVEWAVSYYAANSLGAQIVPMYEAQSEKDWKHIIENSGAKIILAASEKVFRITEPYMNNASPYILYYINYIY